MSGACDGFGVFDHADALCVRADGSYEDVGVKLDLSGLSGGLKVGGTFHVECVDRNGKTRWVDDAKNGATLAGLDSVNNVYFDAATAITTWYIGLVDNAGFTAFAGSDVIGSHSGWSESTAYSNGTRITWGVGSSSSQTVTNASAASFSMNVNSTTIRGMFLVSDNTKGGTSSGLIWSTAAFGTGPQAVNSGDTLKVTYSVSASTS